MKQHYFCTEDDCFIKLKDISTGKFYDFLDIDEKTKDNGIIKEIQDLYSKDEVDGIKKIIGKNYLVILEFRRIDEYKYSDGSDAPASKTGKKITKWMINKISKSVK